METQTETKLRTVEEAIAVLEKEHPHGIDLVYIDYRDSFNEMKDKLNKAIQANDLYSICEDENNIEWFSDSEYATIEEIMKDTFTDEEIDAWNEKWEDMETVKQWFYDHDTSDPIKDLMKNTGKQFFFYDTGLEIPEYPSYGNGESFLTKHAKRIANKLKVDYTKHEKTLRSLVANACYGGSLVLVFYAEPDAFFTDRKDKDANYIKVPKAHLVIMDRSNGSGDQETIDEIVALPFNRKNLWIDSEAGGYSIDSVFGFYLPSFEQTPSLHWVKKARKVGSTKLQAEAETYAKWDEDLKKGICHFADPRFNSHDTEYIMSFPMGNKCKRCGRFYID